MSLDAIEVLEKEEAAREKLLRSTLGGQWIKREVLIRYHRALARLLVTVTLASPGSRAIGGPDMRCLGITI